MGDDKPPMYDKLEVFATVYFPSVPGACLDPKLQAHIAEGFVRAVREHCEREVAKIALSVSMKATEEKYL